MDPMVNSVDSASRPPPPYTKHGSTSTTQSSTTINTSVSSKRSDWESTLQSEGRSGFVSLNPWQWYLSFRSAKIVTVEPVIFLYMFSTYLYFPLYEQYFFNGYGEDQLGDNTSFPFPNGTFCLNSSLLERYGPEGNRTAVTVQKLSNHLIIYISLANRILSIFSTLILGPLSDRIGRRPIILLVSLGMLIQGLLTIVIIHFKLNFFFFILTGFIGGIFGDFAAILMACLSYVSDISTAKWRTVRIGIAEAMIFLGGGIAELSLGYWLQKLDCYFIPPMYLFVGCSCALILYTLIFLPESLTREERRKKSGKKRIGVQTFTRGFKIVFFRIKDYGYSVWKIWIALITLSILVLNVAGSTQLAVYFLKAEPLDWDSSTIGKFQALQQGSHMLGLLVLLPILVLIGLPDALIVLIGVGFNIGTNLCIGFLTETFELFIVGVVQGVEAIMYAPLRGIMSKVVSADDQGALFSIIASAESGATLVSGIIYPIIFPTILEHNLNPGTLYLVMAALSTVTIPLILLLLFSRARACLSLYRGKRKFDTRQVQYAEYSDETTPILPPCPKDDTTT